MTPKRSWAFAALTLTVTAALAGTLLLAGTALARTSGSTATPGHPEAGKKIFQKFCARCHNFAANGTTANAKHGVTGSDLDVLKPRYSRVVSAIVQGEGGLPAEYFLARLTFQQIYDVAAFVAKYAGKPTQVKRIPDKAPSATRR